MIPLYISCEEDFAIHLVPAAPQSSIRELAAAAAGLVVDKRCRQPPATTPRLRRIDAEEFLPEDLTAETAGLAATDWLHLQFVPETQA